MHNRKYNLQIEDKTSKFSATIQGNLRDILNGISIIIRQLEKLPEETNVNLSFGYYIIGGDKQLTTLFSTPISSYTSLYDVSKGSVKDIIDWIKHIERLVKDQLKGEIANESSSAGS